MVKQATKQLKYDEEACEKRIAEREEIIERYLLSLNSAHQVIDGKRILHWVNNDHFITGRDYLFRLLTDRVRLHNLPSDIVIIVQDRILNSVRT